jgi:hypothetical protein
VTPRLRGVDAVLAPVVAGVIAVHALLAWSVLSLVARGDAIGDWVSFYAAGSIVLDGDGARLFDAAAQTASQRAIFGPDAALNYFPLPAFAAMAFAPLSALSFRSSYFVWLAINCVLCSALVALANVHLRGLPRPQRWFVVACLAGSLPVVNLLLLGQVDLVVVAGFAGCFALRSRHPFTAGAVLALALVKPHIVAAPLLMLGLQRDWRVLAGFAAAATPLMVVPAVALGPETLADQLSLLRAQSSAGADGRVNPWMMVNLRGLIVSITGSSATWIWFPPMIVAGGAALGVAMRAWSTLPAASSQTWVIACMLPLVYSPHLHVHALVLACLAWCLYLAADHASAATSARRSVVLTALVTGLWLVSVAGVSLLSLLTITGFIACLRRWPDRNALDARSARPERAAPVAA